MPAAHATSRRECATPALDEPQAGPDRTAPEPIVRLPLGRASSALVVLAFSLTVAYSLHTLGLLGGHRFDSLFLTWINDVVVVVASGACLLRALAIRRERLAWLLISLGLASWVAGNVYYSIVLIHLDPLPIPSVADGLWLGMYPPLIAAVLLLIQSRLTAFRRSLWLDGLIGALVLASMSANLVVDPVFNSSHGSSAATATNLAYPVADLLLLGVAVGAFALRGWQMDRMWALLALGIAALTVTDSLFLVQNAEGTYQVGTIVDSGWLWAVCLFGLAAWQPLVPARHLVYEGKRVLFVPVLFGLAAITIQVWDHFHRVSTLALALDTIALVLILVRLMVTFGEKARMLRSARDDSLTDALTGLGNRRRLMNDLDRFLASPLHPSLLVLCDLDGFKVYNDSLGHLAGDALLERLANAFREAVGPRGTAYRMGGDEFCALIEHESGTLPMLRAARVAAGLADSGSGWTVSASHGLVVLPQEASSASEALRLADQRMYEMKRRGRPPTEEQLRSVLLSALDERLDDLRRHSADVARLAGEVASALRLPAPERAAVELAASLHDIGKVAVPDGILSKPGPLSEAEWAFVRMHPQVGARIMRAAPSLRAAADLVETSHERIDGRGYPAGLSGEQIPLGARIVSVCDAFDAIVTGRPYEPARSPYEAILELEANAGTQFDAAVVDAVVALVRARPVPVEADGAEPAAAVA